MKKWFSNNKLSVAGIIIGTIAGFMYWKFVGCNFGSCLITSKPINSSIYGALIGGLLASLFQAKNKKVNNDI